MEHYLATHFSSLPLFFWRGAQGDPYGTRVETGGALSSCLAMSVPFLRLVSREPKVTGKGCCDQHIVLLVAMSVPFLRLVSREPKVTPEEDVVTPT